MSDHSTVLPQWITNGTAKPFYARREFDLAQMPVCAEILVCGLGQFVLRINGRKVGDHELDPGWTAYDKYIQYVRFDVTGYLRPGRNAVGAGVGNGWYSMELADGCYTFHFPPFMPPNPNPYHPFGESLLLAADLILTYEDGHTEIIRTDSSWRTAPHAIISTNVYGSECMDGRLVPSGWDLPGFDDSAWERAMPASPPAAAVLEEQRQPAVKVIRTYEARFLHTLPRADAAESCVPAQGSGPDGTPPRENVSAPARTAHITRDIYDLGQNVSGILEFEVCGKAGSELRIYPAEKLDERGDADQMARNWMEINSCVRYVIGWDDRWETYRMTFTYLAGRYLAVETDSGSDVQLRGLKVHAITSAWRSTGSFACDDRRYLQIYDLVEKAVEANMLSVHTDCPTIERFAWQEPNHLMAPSIFYMKDGNLLWRKFLRDLRTGQHTAHDRFRDLDGSTFCTGDGLVPSQAPCYIPNVLPVPGMGSFYDIIAWGSTCILGPYWHYLFYGEQDIIAENYDTGLRYLDYLKTKVTADGFISHGLGDWGNPAGEYARENVETAFLYADAKTLAFFAEVLGKEEDRETLLRYAETVKDNYNRKLLIYDREKGHWCYRIWDSKRQETPAGTKEPAASIRMTQAAEALPLYWGMVPEDKTGDVKDAFREVLLRDGSFLCGEVGQPYVIQTAAACGMNDVISRYILKETHPSYYAFVLDGETTLGEYWETNPRSHCHDMMGHIIEWYYNGMAGIRPLSPGFRKVLIRPYLPESMRHLDCTYHSAAGDIRVQMERREEGPVTLTIHAAESIELQTDMTSLPSGSTVRTAGPAPA